MNLLTSSKYALFAKNKCKISQSLLTPQIVKAMKMTFILLTAFFLQLSATGVSQTVTISVKNVPVETVFRQIERQTGLGFLYNKKMLKKLENVSIDVKNAPVAEALSQCFINQAVAFNIENNTIVMHSFRDSFNTKFHQDLKFIFDKEQYLEVLL